MAPKELNAKIYAMTIKEDKALNQWLDKQLKCQARFTLGWKSTDVRIAEGGLNFYFSFLFLFYFIFSFIFDLFSIFRTRVRLEGQDHAVTQQVTSDDMVTSHMTHRRM